MSEAKNSFLSVRSEEENVKNSGIRDSGVNLSKVPESINPVQNANDMRANEVSLSAMKQAFQRKTKHQSSDMWKYVGTLEPKVVIKEKILNKIWFLYCTSPLEISL